MSNQLKKNQLSFSLIWSKFSTLIILVFMVLIFGAIAKRSFLNPGNLVTIIEHSAINILLACGEFFAILLAGIDLSVGSTMALSGVVMAKLMSIGLPASLAVFLGIFVLGLVIGFANGFLINLTGLHPFIITLGTQSILRGLTVIIANARSVSGVSSSFVTTVGGKLFAFIPVPVLIAFTTAALLAFFSFKTQAGRNLYALGGNKQAAWYAGIHVKLHTLMAFMISGLCASLAGMVNVARLTAAEPNAGTGYETFAIAAVIIGGTSFFGGSGRIPMVVVGGLIIGVINNGLNMIGLSSYFQMIAMGALIITAVTLDHFFGSDRSKR